MTHASEKVLFPTRVMHHEVLTHESCARKNFMAHKLMHSNSVVHEIYDMAFPTPDSWQLLYFRN
jgi:hypothetical protein